MAKNLFKKSENAPAPKKSEKMVVTVTDPAFEKKLASLASINEQIDALNAEAAALSGEIKPRLIEEFVGTYKKLGKFPGSFNVVAGKSSVMFVGTDRYITIDKDRSDELIAMYGADIAGEKDTYTMDPEMVEKYGEIISDLIGKCKKIEEDDKDKLIVVTTKYSVKKGTITDLATKFGKFPMDRLVEDIRPVFQMKGVKVNKK